MREAAKRAPGTITQQHRGQPASRKSFKVWTVSQLLETYRDPRAILLEIASMDTAKLAAEMHGTLADALAERRLCAQAVLPYVAQKLPVQVDMRHTRAIHLNIVDDRQYQELVEVAATQDDADTFSMQLLPTTTTADSETVDRTGQAIDEQATAQAIGQGSERPVTPNVADAPTGEE
jgi:hypothetical protein